MVNDDVIQPAFERDLGAPRETTADDDAVADLDPIDILRANALVRVPTEELHSDLVEDEVVRLSLYGQTVSSDVATVNHDSGVAAVDLHAGGDDGREGAQGRVDTDGHRSRGRKDSRVESNHHRCGDVGDSDRLPQGESGRATGIGDVCLGEANVVLVGRRGDDERL